jgi:hypothetical protein
MSLSAAIDIRPAEAADLWLLASEMRAADAAEARASIGVSPLIALYRSARDSCETWSVRLSGELACVFGVVAVEQSALGPRTGCVWMASTAAVKRHREDFWTMCWDALSALLDRWDTLANLIDARYEKAVRWGKRLGFQFQTPAPYGVEGRDFLAFTVTKENFAWALAQQYR